jgi:branched-chain amino acid transport system substrate-binding protein
MRPFYKYILGICIICLIYIINTQAQEQDKIPVGMSAAFSGPSRDLGYELYNGMMVYLDQVNRAGGVNGREIELIAYDDGYNPLPAINNTLKLVDEDKVFLLISYIGTPTVTRVLPLLKIFEDKEVYLFFPFTGAEPQRKLPYKDYVFNLRPSYRQETEGLVRNFVNIARPRIAVFYQADAYGRSGWDGVRRALDKYGLDIVAEATYRRGDEFGSGYGEQVEILRRANPDAIISIAAYEASAGFIRDARDSGWDIPIANVSFVGSESMLELLIQAGGRDSKDYTRNLVNSEVVPNYMDDSLPAVREYRRLMADYVPKMPSTVKSRKEDAPVSGNTEAKHGFVSFEGFLNAKLLVEVLKRLEGEIKQSGIRRAVESITDYDIGIGETVSFNAESNQGLNRVYFNTAKDGRYVPIKNWSIFKK